MPGHVVEIDVPEIGTLVNPVVRAGDLIERSPHDRDVTGAPARNYVGGDWRESAGGETYEKHNPWRPSEVTGVYAASTAEDAAAAIEAARGAFGAGRRFRLDSAPPSSARPLTRSRRALSRSPRT